MGDSYLGKNTHTHTLHTSARTHTAHSHCTHTCMYTHTLHTSARTHTAHAHCTLTLRTHTAHSHCTHMHVHTLHPHCTLLLTLTLHPHTAPSHCTPPSLQATTMAFLELYSDPGMNMSQLGYCLTNCSAAMRFIMELTPDKLRRPRYVCA